MSSRANTFISVCARRAHRDTRRDEKSVQRYIQHERGLAVNGQMGDGKIILSALSISDDESLSLPAAGEERIYIRVEKKNEEEQLHRGIYLI